VKLRIQDNSLRFRLTQREVMRLKNTGNVEAEVRFTADRALQYSVNSAQGLETIEVEYAADCVRVLLPYACVSAWAESDEVAIVGHGQVRVLVEKDFQCLHGRDRRDPDAWPNPLAEQRSA
jgi:hypothetical protein